MKDLKDLSMANAARASCFRALLRLGHRSTHSGRKDPKGLAERSLRIFEGSREAKKHRSKTPFGTTAPPNRS